MKDRRIARRDFVRLSAAFGALGALEAFSYARSMGASDRINLAIVGAGQRGRALLEEIRALAPEMNARIAAVCDIWRIPRERISEEVRAWGEPPERCRNTDELYALKDIDAVIIATADHQHAKMCAEAVRRGKDAYVECPLAHFLDDAVEVRKAVLASGKVVQVGTQRRSVPRYAAAAEAVRSGRSGKIISADLSWNTNNPGLWRREAEVAQLRGKGSPVSHGTTSMR